MISYRANATDVGGIISSDTTWTLAGSPYNATSIVQVAEGVTLTIEPGAIFTGSGTLTFATGSYFSHDATQCFTNTFDVSSSSCC